MVIVYGTEVTVNLKAIHCADCNIIFGIPDDFQQRRINDHKGFYCPNGHSNAYYGKSEKEKLQEEDNRLNNLTEYKQKVIQEKNQQIEQLGYNLRAQKAAKTKIINRVKNGVCPCCNRTFQNLQNHFKTVHPELLK